MRAYKIRIILILMVFLLLVIGFQWRQKWGTKAELGKLAITLAGSDAVFCGESTDDDNREQYQKFQSCMVRSFQANKTILAYTEDHDMSFFAQIKRKVQITCRYVIIRPKGKSLAIRWTKDQGQSAQVPVKWSLQTITEVITLRKGSGDYLYYE